MAKRRIKRRKIPAQTPRTETVRHAPGVELTRDALDVFRHKPELSRLYRERKRRHEPIRPRPTRPWPDFRPVEDLRHDTKEQDRGFRTVRGRTARIKTRPQGEVHKTRLHTPVHSYFLDPQRVLVCIRREARKRVLFALRRAGRGKRVSREHRFTDKSYIRCK